MSRKFWTDVGELAAMRDALPEDRRPGSGIRNFFAPLIQAAESKRALEPQSRGVDMAMRCERCDKDVNDEMEHYADVRYENGDPVHELSGWRCDAINWRLRAIVAEAEVAKLKDRCRTLEQSIHDLWSNSNA